MIKITVRYTATILTLVFTGCASAQPSSRSHATATEDLEKLIQFSQMEQREHWWPAVKQLGRIAATDDTLRKEIWKRAKVNTLGMKFVHVEPGTFTMGPDFHRVFNIQWGHSVKITQPYYMAVTEITNAQFKEMFPELKVYPRYSPDPDSPAVKVSWKQADGFCKLLSEKEGVRYRLPTESEWEYACRAGSRTRFCYGWSARELADYAWYTAVVADDKKGSALRAAIKKGSASRVALLRPNNWGLFDMHGNALEWVADRYSDSYYSECRKKGTVQDPPGPEKGWGHVLRGGAWPFDLPATLTSTARFPLPILNLGPFLGPFAPLGIRETIGFRVVRVGGDSPDEKTD